MKAIPHGVWIALIGVERLCAVGLVVPLLNTSWVTVAMIAAAGIGAELLLFSGVHNDGTACSELESFHGAPITVCSAGRI